MTDKMAMRYLSPVKSLMKKLDFDRHYIEALDYAIKNLKEGSQSKWIPVSERLPDVDGGEYLVYRKTDAFIKRPFCIDIARWYSDDTENNGFNKYSEVIAWMPLPEPYKEAENER